MIDDWIDIKFLFWSLNVCITNRDFSNALSMSRCLISSTNRELKMRTSNDTSFLFIDWKTSFSMRSLIFFCLNAANWERAMCTIESSLSATANSEIEMKSRARSTVVLNTKLKYAVDAKYFRDRSRSRLNEFEKISNSDSWFEATNWSFDWDIIDDFETDAMIEKSIIEIKNDEFSRSTWSS
jgi:hypothetical protein